MLIGYNIYDFEKIGNILCTRGIYIIKEATQKKSKHLLYSVFFSKQKNEQTYKHWPQAQVTMVKKA